MMDSWLNDPVRYPQLLTERDLRLQRQIANRSDGSGNIIRIRVQGRRSADRESGEPRISVETFNLGPSQHSTPSKHASVTIGTSRTEHGVEIPIRHLVTSPDNLPGVMQQIPISRKISSKGPFKAEPLKRINRPDLTKLKDCYEKDGEGIADDLFDSFGKQFDDLVHGIKTSKLKSSGRYRTEWDGVSEKAPPKKPEAEKISINTTTIKASGYPDGSNNTQSSSDPRKVGSAAVTRAKMILDRVLKDLVSKEDVDSGYSGSGGTRAGFTLTPDEIRDKIKRYNDIHDTHKMTQDLSEGGTFHGDILVNICLDQPVNMLLRAQQTAVYDALNQIQATGDGDSIKASVTLPKNTTTSLHVSSDESVNGVVQRLLHKFNVLDDAKEFALFEQTLDSHCESEIKLRTLASSEKPLLSYLKWKTESQEKKRFVLKESDKAEIMWEAFSVPELANFLRMLELEHQREVESIKEKYDVQRKNMLARMDELKTC